LTSAGGAMGVRNSSSPHMVTRITRANTGDKLNGDVLVIERPTRILRFISDRGRNRTRAVAAGHERA
jgi:hypothetical protein